MDMQRRFTSSVAPLSNTLYAYDSRDYRLVTFDTYAGELTYQFRDLGGRVLRESKVTAATSGPVSNWERWEHQKDYVYGPEGLLATVAHDGTPHYFHKDHLGTPRAITDRFGALSGRHDYYPFGEEADNTPLYDDFTVKFTGHQRDLHGLSDYMMGRTCLWPLRRFASVDKGRDGWNMYAYTRNNPVNYVDPDGHVGVALNDQAKAGVLFIAGDDASAVSFDDNGTISVAASAEQLANNSGLSFLNSLAQSDKKIGLIVGTEIDFSGGTIQLDSKRITVNLSTTKDSRSSHQKFPPEGFDGMVGVFEGVAAVRTEGGSVSEPRPASLGLVFFHEAVENLSTTSRGLQYKDAHSEAIEAERQLRRERPELENFAFGAGPYARKN